jgi:very-short-patch-repair endonuclease
MAWWLEQVLRPAILRYKHRSERAAIDSELHALMDLARRWQTPASSQPIRDLAAAVIGRDLDAYVNAHAQVEELRDRVEPVQRRDALLEKLRGRAPEFAISVGPGEFQRLESHGSLDDAWSYALIAQELSDRHSLSLDEIKNDLDRFKRELDSITIQLASCQAWAAQHRRVTQPVVSALSRFHEAQRKIGGGKGARVPELQRTMRNAMRDAKDAFPVWIMPLHDLTRSFDFTKTKFDVVIVDESSQLSAVGLITLLIADSAIVVGDDEQTEPSLAGVPMESVQAVIREHLVDFNDGVLWSPDSSLYSFAGRFGTTVGLREHFRCVPQIISFSSKLCYQSRIQALRDPSEVLQLPHVVPVLCPPIELNATGDVTETEALEIACLVVACSEQEEYKNQSFGVIALRGSAGSRGDDPQTARITELIRDTLGPTKWEQFAARSKFKTGVPPAFQGDERDVVLISLGDDPNRGTGDGSGPLRLISDTTLPGISYKKRMNVAVSRARNQVFIAHSLNHFEAHLKENDIRRRLLEFAYAPDEWLEATNTHNPQAESPFEQAVYADLVGRGYHVTPQVAAGHYRIDLVAKGSAGQVAIECDGDAYHQDAAADLARQLVLERCGWRFIRVRGSEYYKDPEAAINRIVGELNGFGVSQCSASIDPSEVSGELLTRVRSRAQEIREIILGGKQLAERVEPKRMSEQSLEEVALAAVHSEAVSITPEAGSAHDSELLFEIQPRQGDSVFGTPDVVDEPQARPNVPQPMEPYVEFTEVGFPDPKECSDEAVCRDLVRIVEVEGPATAARILDKYRIAVGYGRLRGSTRERIEHALETCQRKGILLAAHDYDCADQMVYRFPGTLDVRLRKRGPRDWEDVPMGEIVAVMKVTADTYWHLSQEALFRQVLAAFDLKKLTSGTAERLSIAYGLYKRQTLDSPDSNAGPSGL